MIEPEACERCERPTPSSELRIWMQTERKRVFSGLDVPSDPTTPAGERPVFDYVHQDHAYRVCGRCFAELSAGAPFSAPAQRRSITMLVVIIVLMAALAAATPFILPALMSAFWRT